MLDSPFPPEQPDDDDSGLELAERLRRRSHRIATLILQSDLPWIDIGLEIARMREAVEAEAPDKLPLFERIYAARFQRLREQWRDEEDRPYPCEFDPEDLPDWG